MHELLAKANFDRDVKLLSPHFLAAQNWLLHSADFPIIDVTFLGGKPLRVKLQCDQWPELPPAAELLAPDGIAPARGLPGGVFHPDAHAQTQKPFVCMRGFREYHTHPSHLNDHWATYRAEDGMNLPGLLAQLSRSWRKAVGR